MKPFNLERALAGDPVVTRDGREVTQLKLFQIPEGSNDPLWGVVDERIESWNTDGNWVDEEDPLDLFMATPVMEGWACVQRLFGEWGLSEKIYATREEAAERGHVVAYVTWEIEP